MNIIVKFENNAMKNLLVSKQNEYKGLKEWIVGMTAYIDAMYDDNKALIRKLTVDMSVDDFDEINYLKTLGLPGLKQEYDKYLEKNLRDGPASELLDMNEEIISHLEALFNGHD